MTAPHDTPEAVEAMANSCATTALAQKQRGLCCGETDCGGTCCAPACLFGETMRDLNNAAAMLRRLHQRAVDAEAKVACCRASNTGYLVENDALRFERNNLRAALEPRKPWEVLREAADIIARESGHTEGGAAFDFLTFEAARLEAAAAPKVPTLAEAAENLLAALGSTLVSREVGTAYSALKDALARAENGA